MFVVMAKRTSMLDKQNSKGLSSNACPFGRGPKGGNCENFSRDARVILWSLKFDYMLFWGFSENQSHVFLGFVKIIIICSVKFIEI